jgi:5'(3')-deoxyribonucleotidase
MSKKLKIGVDIDEILAPFNNNFIDFLNKKINTNYKVENFSSYNIEEETGHTKEEIHELLDEFSISLNAKEMMPIFGAVESIFDLQKMIVSFML